MINPKIDLLASREHYFDHVAPVWEELPLEMRGNFFIPEDMNDYASERLIDPSALFCYNRGLEDIEGDNPILTCAYGDMVYAYRTNFKRTLIMMEHGIGHTFGTVAYPNGPGKRDFVKLFLPPNNYTMKKMVEVRPKAEYAVVGTPKTDWAARKVDPIGGVLKVAKGRKVAIGFHWGTRRNNPPESGTAFEHYKEAIPALAEQYDLIAYGHPLDGALYKDHFESLGIPYLDNFAEVMRQADVCINDLSSVLYEFLVTGKPVIVLNAPWFRRTVHHGIRFWDYSDIGLNVEEPGRLPAAIDATFERYGEVCATERVAAVRDLYPYLGHAAERAASVLVDYVRGL